MDSVQDHAGPGDHESSDGLLDRVEVIEAQPLEQRANGYDQLADELLTELQRSDHEPGAPRNHA